MRNREISDLSVTFRCPYDFKVRLEAYLQDRYGRGRPSHAIRHLIEGGLSLYRETQRPKDRIHHSPWASGHGCDRPPRPFRVSTSRPQRVPAASRC